MTAALQPMAGSRPSRQTPRMPLQRNGSALVVVLWVIALLAVLISGFAFDMHMESRIVSHLRKKVKAEYLARAGIERAKMLLMRSQQIKGKDDPEDTKAEPWYADAKRLKQGKAIIGLTDALGEGSVIVDITPEPALRNINSLKDEDWERVFKVGGVPEELWSELIDSVNDWRDADDQPNLDGAETDDYYAKLAPPYKARGRKGTAANLDTVDELMLVKGWTRAILHGGPLVEGETNGVVMRGIADLLTAMPEVGAQVNVNAAGKDVLLTLPGIDDVMADAILAEREGGRDGLTAGGQMDQDYFFTDANNFFSRVPELNSMNPTDRAYLNTLINTASKALRITSVGRVHGVDQKIVSLVSTQ
jgi:general secretion pathway protein K